jgi:uncharacterized protein involved in outer membrane biogenesis
LALLAAVPYLVDLPRVRTLIAHSASQALGRPVRFSAVSVQLVPWPAVELRGLEVAEDPRFGPTPFVTLERGVVRLRLWPLVMGRLEFGGLTLKRPLIRLVEGADGRWNVGSLGVVQAAASTLRSPEPMRELRGPGPATAASLLAAGVVVDEAVVTYSPRGGGADAYRLTSVDVELRGAGQRLTFEGTAILMPGGITLKLTEGALAIAGSRPLAEAPVSGTLTLEGGDLGPLAGPVLAPEFGASGQPKGTLALGGVLGSPRASGQVTLPHLVVSQRSRRCAPPERRLTVDNVSLSLSLAERQLLGRPATANIASGTVGAELTATLDGGLGVTLSDIRVRRLPLKGVLVDFLCEGYAVTGPLDLTGSLAFRVPAEPGALTGAGRFAIGRGEVVGARAIKLFGDVVRLGESVALVLGEGVASPLEFESITGTYRIGHGVATTPDLLYTGRGFTVRAAGTYTLSSDGLNVDMVVRHRRGQVKAKVTGSAAAPVLRVDVAGVVRDTEAQVGQGLADLLKRLR